MKTGIELIAEERMSQIEKHGKTLDHDIEAHNWQVLAYNAAVLAAPYKLYEKGKFANTVQFKVADLSEGWKLPNLNHEGNVIKDNDKLEKEERIKQLVVAGALIAAEIDRLNKINP